MPPGTDGDDEELVEIDVEIDGPPPLPEASAPELGRASCRERVSNCV
jgi:hypothetical protein